MNQQSDFQQPWKSGFFHSNPIKIAQKVPIYYSKNQLKTIEHHKNSMTFSNPWLREKNLEKEEKVGRCRESNPVLTEVRQLT